MISVVGLFARYIGYLLFLVMIVMPTIYQELKLALLLVVLCIILIRLFIMDKGTLHLHPVVFHWMLFLTSVSLIFTLRGFVDGAPGALQAGRVYVLWPLAFTLLISGITTEREIIGLIRIMIFGAFINIMLRIRVIPPLTGVLPVEFIYKLIDALMFLVPFLIATLLTLSIEKKTKVIKYWFLLALSLGIWGNRLLVLLNSRTALLLVVILSIPFTIFFCAFLTRKQNKSYYKTASFSLIGVGLLLLMFNFYIDSTYSYNFSIMFERAKDAFDFEGSVSWNLRKDQFFALMSGFFQHPLLGAGHGAGLNNIVRDDEAVWIYELSYIALLYHVGLIGFIAYSSGVIWIYWMGIRLIRNGGKLGLYMVPTLVGMTCFLIANATNQYLLKFDFMWVIFLPVALINYWLVTKKDQMKNSPEHYRESVTSHSRF